MLRKNIALIERLQKHGGQALAKGCLQEAEDIYLRLCSLTPDNPDIWLKLGALSGLRGDITSSIQHTRKAIQLQPDNADSHYNLAHALDLIGRHEEAEESYRHTLRLNPRHADAENNLGNILRATGRPLEALECFDRAVSINPFMPQARCNRSLAYLLLADFERGWKEFEWRWARAEHRPRNLPKPQWRGEPLLGKRLIIHEEQGYGDSIQFIRYATLIGSHKPAWTILACRKELQSLLGTAPGVDEVISFQQLDSVDYDIHVPLLSLPGIFKTTLETIPDITPYLCVPRGDYTDVQHALPPATHKKVRIGIAWAGSDTHVNDSNRSCPFEFFNILLNATDCTFISLQKGNLAQDIKNHHTCATNIDHLLRTFADTAFVISNLDLVITVDTAVAHLAGALGKPVWLLLPYDPDWRWLLKRNDTPWYPSFKLYRQNAPKEWERVISQALLDLCALSRQA